MSKIQRLEASVGDDGHLYIHKEDDGDYCDSWEVTKLERKYNTLEAKNKALEECVIERDGIIEEWDIELDRVRDENKALREGIDAMQKNSIHVAQSLLTPKPSDKDSG